MTLLLLLVACFVWYKSRKFKWFAIIMVCNFVLFACNRTSTDYGSMREVCTFGKCRYEVNTHKFK